MGEVSLLLVSEGAPSNKLAGELRSTIYRMLVTLTPKVDSEGKRSSRKRYTILFLTSVLSEFEIFVGGCPAHRVRPLGKLREEPLELGRLHLVAVDDVTGDGHVHQGISAGDVSLWHLHLEPGWLLFGVVVRFHVSRFD